MPNLLIITHPEVIVDPNVPVTDWGLSETGRDRATTFAASSVFADVTQIWTSTERKARETGDILAASQSLSVAQHLDLGENDRSSTGFLPPTEFETAADAFFAHPDVSFRGWETARDAQSRVLSAVNSIIGAHEGQDLAIATHGAVGTLLWCALSNRPIDRIYDQPSQGHYWQADISTLKPQSGWLPMA